MNTYHWRFRIMAKSWIARKRASLQQNSTSTQQCWIARSALIPKGMGQKLGLIGAFMVDQPFMILDEPMSGLDPRARICLKEVMLRAKREGKTLFSVHIFYRISTKYAIVLVLFMTANWCISERRHRLSRPSTKTALSVRS